MCQDCQPELQLDQCIDGYNAFTITTANFTMPAENSVVNVAVSNLGQNTGKWGVIGQVVYVYNAGYMQVTASSPTSLTLRNLKNTSAGYYMGNAAPGTNILTGSKVSPAGLQGPTGNAAKSGQILIDVDYNDYINNSNSFVLQKTIGIDSDIFVSDKDTVELQLNLINSNTLVSSFSFIKFEIDDGSNTVNLLPNDFTFFGGIAIPSNIDYEKSIFYKLHISKNTNLTFNIMLEMDTVNNSISGGDCIYGSQNFSPPDSVKYKTLNLGSITFGNPLSLKIYTFSGSGENITINWIKTIKQKLI